MWHGISFGESLVSGTPSVDTPHNPTQPQGIGFGLVGGAALDPFISLSTPLQLLFGVGAGCGVGALSSPCAPVCGVSRLPPFVHAQVGVGYGIGVGMGLRLAPFGGKKKKSRRRV